MIKFKLRDSSSVIDYDPSANLLLKDGVPYSFDIGDVFSHDINLRIVLGKKCNYSCSYCLQANSKDAKEARIDLNLLASRIKNFLGDRKIGSLSFWGGEPLLYMDDIKTLFNELKLNFAHSDNGNVSIVTNGSLLAKDDIFNWIWENIEDVFITISYDGPGQDLRGPNIFDDPIIRKRVFDLGLKNKLGISTVMTQHNSSIFALLEDLKTRFNPSFNHEVELDFLQVLNEESAAAALTEDGLKACLLETYSFLVSNPTKVMPSFQSLIALFLSRLGMTDQINSCHAMSGNTISIDLEGNILVCQNKSSSDGNENESYCLANIKDLEPGAKVPIPQGSIIRRRWKERCEPCLVKHFCGGGCLVADECWQDYNCQQMVHKYLLVLMCMVTMVSGGIISQFEVANG